MIQPPGPQSAAAIAAAVRPILREAVALHQQGQLVQAQTLYEQVLRHDPHNFDALHLLGVLACQTRDAQRAVTLIQKALAIDGGSADAHLNLGAALQQLAQPEAALASYERAIALQPDHAGAYLNRGNTLKGLQRMPEAVASYRRAIAVNPDYAEAYSTLGNTLQELDRCDEALENIDRALQLQPGFMQAHYNRGVTLQRLRRWQEALHSYDQALAIDPDYPPALNNRGVTLHALRRWDEALASLDRAVRVKPDDAVAHCNRGCTLQELKWLDAALDSYRQAIRLAPDYADAHNNCADVLIMLQRYAPAVRASEQLLALAPDYPFGKGRLLYAKMLSCDWRGLDELCASLSQDLMRGRPAVGPFGYLAVAESEALLRRCAEIYAARHFPGTAGGPGAAPPPRRARIRVGYVSGEFRDHATARLMAELWELHDKNRFEILAFDNGWDDGSPMRTRISNAFQEIIPIAQLSDAAAADLVRARGTDILVNLNGFFGEARQGLFALRPSPIQVGYLGFPGTMGADYIDYLIADRTVVPDGSRQHYCEKIVCLPHSYQVNDRKRTIADAPVERQALGLPPSGFVFCCFNNCYKITPRTFDVWMRILSRVPASVLWLFEENPAAAENLRKEAAARGVNAARLIFAARLPLAQHLARQRAADLFLDTLPCNAHTTASDALWAGLPLLTCAGTTFAGRVASSLLEAIGLPELITVDLQAYEAAAVELATDPVRLGQIRRKLEHNRLDKPLFDTPLIIRHIEAAYVGMVERMYAGLPPAAMDIAALQDRAN